MRLSDLFNLDRGPENLVNLAVYSLAVVVVFRIAAEILNRLSAIQVLAILVVLILISPVAYHIRKSRSGHTSRESGRRGAERTPVLPQNGDIE